MAYRTQTDKEVAHLQPPQSLDAEQAVLGSILIRRPEIVHVETNSFAGFFEKSFLALLASLLGRKVVMHVHGGRFREFYQDACRLGKWLIGRCLAVNDRVVAATPRMRETFEMIGLPSEKVALLANAVDLPAESIWDAARQREGASEGPSSPHRRPAVGRFRSGARPGPGVGS